MTTYRVTPLSVSIHLEGESPVYGQSSMHVSIEDEAAGPFIVLEQIGDDLAPGTVAVEMEQLEIIMREAKKLMNAQPKELET